MSSAFFLKLCLVFSVTLWAADSTKVRTEEKIKLDDGVKARAELLGDKLPAAEAEKKPLNLSRTFVLDTEQPEKTSGRAKANDGDEKPVFTYKYNLSMPARVTATILQKDSLIKRLYTEEKQAGLHRVYWDGLTEAGVKLFGDFECRIQIQEKGGKEEQTKQNFRVK